VSLHPMAGVPKPVRTRTQWEDGPLGTDHIGGPGWVPRALCHLTMTLYQLFTLLTCLVRVLSIESTVILLTTDYFPILMVGSV
jgi:hypothetical protein